MDYRVNVQEAINYIEKDLEVHADLALIAQQAALSLPHLYRLFYSLTGHSIKDYIRKRRISIASEDLRNTAMPIIDIALKAGFETQASFSKAFKKWVGLSPDMYRASQQHFCFNRIQLVETVEESNSLIKDLNVKVLRLKPMLVLVYRHVQLCKDGLERNALQRAKLLVKDLLLNTDKLRFLGRNIELASSSHIGYEILIPVQGEGRWETKQLKLELLSGGLYAMAVSSAKKDQEVLSAWNTLVSEWLPKSSFIMKNPEYLEEYIVNKEKLIRMKLYLPIERKCKANMIKIQNVSPFCVAYSRVQGVDSSEQADQQLCEWLEHIDFDWRVEGQLYFSYALNPNDEGHWSEYGVSIKPELEFLRHTYIQRKIIGDGDYACMRTKALGSLKGVLELMQGWIKTNPEYRADDSRQWFAKYILSGQSAGEEEIEVICYLPVIVKGNN
ncbi:AraC family transcriptional regulator [Bacillus horti]|uniref:AraC-like DNA-binding protein/DNA gyrase inhibitor GyrI n=1 Tax=Caldalkalibacillus horti TaxID=77523 RepID=A0ABT9VXR4_9BACI|nr:AraC family transcriptional regulator [Bacillus horti]MDQ0165405.1 AraC-like DNA-binding protein/DNA gyrase inhibitor GyrI [Bacillus horti]